MTTSELLKSLNPEQTTALLSLRDEIHASNSVAMGELVASKDAEIATHRSASERLIAIKAAVLDPATETESAVLAIIDRDEKDKAIEAATAERDAAQERLDKLTK